MSEFDNLPDSESFENAPRRPPFRQNRPPSRPPYYAPRGRGRTGTDPHVKKALKIFGVPDLRDLLDRKHQEEQLRSEDDLPNDPTYNFLRDPSRGDSDQRQVYKDDRGHQPRAPRGRGRFKGPPEHSFIQNPLNIKVEVETATGQRHYSMNHENILPDIKHVPDHNENNNESGRGRGMTDRRIFRGRVRHDVGRGRYETTRGRDESDTNESEWDGSTSFRGRGRGRDKSDQYTNESEWDRSTSFRGRGRDESEWDRSTSFRGSGRGRDESDINESERDISTSFRGRGRGRYALDLDTNESERDRTSFRGRGRGRYESTRGRDEADVYTNETYGDREAGERATDGNRNESQRGRKDSGRGRSGRGRGRGRDPRGRGGPPRAKSSERHRPMQSVEENGDDSNRGARIRSRSAEIRDRSEKKNVEAEIRGRGRGGRGRGRGSRRGGKYKQEQASTIDAPSGEAESSDESISEDTIVANQTVVESTNKAVGLEEEFDEQISQYADDGVEEGDHHEVENKDEIVEIKENLIITSIDPKQKKRIVRFDLEVDDNAEKPTNSETVVNEREDSELIEDGIEKLNLKSSE